MTALAATIMMGMILPAFGGEGRKSILQGYGTSKIEAYHPDPIYLTVNRAIYLGEERWTTKSIRDREYHRLVDETLFATRLWENVPTARVRFGMTYITSVTDLDSEGRPFNIEDGRNMITLNGSLAEEGKWGQCFWSKKGFDIRIERYLCQRPDAKIKAKKWNQSRRSYRTYLKERRAYRLRWKRTFRQVSAHEIGHGIRLTHSYLNNRAIETLTSRKSLQSVMSYGCIVMGPHEAISGVVNGRLNPDDVSAVSRLYPNYRNRISRTTGLVRGVVVDRSGTRELYGTNVILVRNGRGIISRISGYATSLQVFGDSPTLRGDFELDGVPPGTYDLLVSAPDDPDVPLNGVEICWFNEELSEKGFERAWVRRIIVRAGEDVHLGYVQVGVDRPFIRPGLLDLDIPLQIPGEGTYQVRVERKFTLPVSLRRYFPRVRSRYVEVHRSEPVEYTRGNHLYIPRLAPRRYAVSLYKKSARGWDVVFRRKAFDFRARLVDLRWDRAWKKVRTTNRGKTRVFSVEAWRYVLSVKGKYRDLTANLHGKRARMFFVGTPTSTRLEADWGGDAVKVSLR